MTLNYSIFHREISIVGGRTRVIALVRPSNCVCKHKAACHRLHTILPIGTTKFIKLINVCKMKD